MKDMDKEIEDILKETPLENKSNSKANLKTKSPGKKRRFPKKKTILIIGVMIIVIGGFILLSNPCEVCDICETCKECVQEISMENLKQQIINKGYAEIGKGTDILKLSPYNG